MKIGFIVTEVSSAPGFENNVSAHVQLPLHTMRLLIDAGHTVQLITTKFQKNHTLPVCLPEGIKIHQVVDGRRRGNGLVMEVGFKKGIRPLRFIKQLLHIKKIVITEKYDILHFFGSYRMAYFAGLMSLIGVKTPLVLTCNFAPPPKTYWTPTKYLWNRLSLIITSTEFLRNKFKTAGIMSEVCPHGIVRNIEEEIAKIPSNLPHRVLFWRDPSWENGADICLEVYKHLAPRFPDVSFDLAIRPHWHPVNGIKEICEEHPNINVYYFPYEHGISLPQLIAESICILLPFRELSTHPQFSVMESMISGVPVVTTAIDSNNELIDSSLNSYLVPAGDVQLTINIIEKLLVDRMFASYIGKQASKHIHRNWNWGGYISKLVDKYSGLIN